MNTDYTYDKDLSKLFPTLDKSLYLFNYTVIISLGNYLYFHCHV
jgi:hypothetical protein